MQFLLPLPYEFISFSRIFGFPKFFKFIYLFINLQASFLHIIKAVQIYKNCILILKLSFRKSFISSKKFAIQNLFKKSLHFLPTSKISILLSKFRWKLASYFKLLVAQTEKNDALQRCELASLFSCKREKEGFDDAYATSRRWEWAYI